MKCMYIKKQMAIYEKIFKLPLDYDTIYIVKIY